MLYKEKNGRVPEWIMAKRLLLVPVRPVAGVRPLLLLDCGSVPPIGVAQLILLGHQLKIGNFRRAN